LFIISFIFIFYNKYVENKKPLAKRLTKGYNFISRGVFVENESIKSGDEGNRTLVLNILQKPSTCLGHDLRNHPKLYYLFLPCNLSFTPDGLPLSWWVTTIGRLLPFAILGYCKLSVRNECRFI